MPIVVEDGTGLLTANSYASVAYADAYFTDRNNDQWLSLTLAQKEGSLVQATDYVDMWYGSKFKGVAKVEAQSLAWPRTETGLLEELPDKLLRATCEYALRASSAPLNADVVTDASGQIIQKLVERVGPIEEETTYHSPSIVGFAGKQKPILAADLLLRTLLRNTGGGVIRN